MAVRPCSRSPLAPLEISSSDEDQEDIRKKIAEEQRIKEEFVHPWADAELEDGTAAAYEAMLGRSMLSVLAMILLLQLW